MDYDGPTADFRGRVGLIGVARLVVVNDDIAVVQVPDTNAEAVDIETIVRVDMRVKCRDHETIAALTSYDWPGNVREFRSALEYAFVACHESLIRPSHLPPGILKIEERRLQPMDPPADESGYKKRALIEALRKTGGNQSEAARLLGVSRVTVWSRIKKYKIDIKKSVN